MLNKIKLLLIILHFIARKLMTKRGKIALLFLTRKEINQAHLWKTALLSQKQHFNAYIHSKEQIEDSYFAPLQISDRVPTTYLVHAKAWQQLLRTSLNDQENQLFVFLSESCIPLYPLELIYTHLIKDNHSYMMYGAPWWDNDHPREITEIPKEHRLGNAEWLILNRRHAQMIVEDEKIIHIASNHIHDQESYPSILFSLKNCLNEIIYRQITYAETNPADYPHPFSLDKADELALNHIKKGKNLGCLFARKFTKSFPEETLLSLQKTPLISFHHSLNTESDPIKNEVRAFLQLEEMNTSNLATTFTFLVNHLNLKTGYEINALSGLHMKRLLTNSRIEKIYGIDTYNHPEFQFNQQVWDMIVSTVDASLTDFRPRAQLIKTDPMQVALTVKDQSIDFVFINESHLTRESIDLIAAWFPKVRKNGLIAGYRRPSIDYFIPHNISDFFQSHHIEAGHVNRLEPGFWYAQI